jgi:nucleotide-binding universal stress UspA family protein
MIYLAYDGSLNGDWISRYAFRLASQTPEKKLHLIHIEDTDPSRGLVKKKILDIEQECRSSGINLGWEILPLEKSVFHSLLKAIPQGSKNCVVCGTRVRSKRHSYLSGTVSEQLLKQHKFNVMAVRVVQPGLLGNPHDFLIPLAGHPRGFKSGWPIFRLFLPQVATVFLLRCIKISALRSRHLSLQKKRALHKTGFKYLSTVQDEILKEKGTTEFFLDLRVVVNTDWVREILVHASTLKVHMILLGASERTLSQRVMQSDPFERLLRDSPCDVGIYRGI